LVKGQDPAIIQRSSLRHLSPLTSNRIQDI